MKSGKSGRNKVMGLKKGRGFKPSGGAGQEEAWQENNGRGALERARRGLGREGGDSENIEGNSPPHKERDGQKKTST